MKRSVQMLCVLVAAGWSVKSQAYENHLVDHGKQLQLSLWSGAENELSKTDRLEKIQFASLALECKSCVEYGSSQSDIGKPLETGKGVLTNLAQASGDALDYPFKPSQPRKPWRKPLGWTLVGVGGAAIITGFICHMYAWDLSSDPVSPVDKPKVDAEIDDYTLAAVIFYGSGVLVAASGLALLLWEEYVPFTPQVAVSPKHASLAISGVF